MSPRTRTIDNGSSGASIHVPLQGKGGVGVSLISSAVGRHPSVSWGPLEQFLRVMYISHAWIVTDLDLQEFQAKNGRNRAQTAKCSFWSLQCPALKCPRQAPAGEASVFGRIVV